MDVANALQGRRALVTGATGFKGTWLSTWLERLGACPVGVGLPPTEAMCDGWPAYARNAPWFEVDIRDARAVQRSVDLHQPEIIFHLAAQPLVRESYLTPVATLASNVMGTAHVLEAARNSESVQAVVVVSSDKCYANQEWQWGYRESEPLGGDDPYSASKACTEIVTAAYRRSFSRSSVSDVASDWLVASGRAGNVIGGGDWADDRLVPDIIRAAIDDRPIELRYPQAARPWQHVLEPLAGYLMLGARLLQKQDAFADSWNFGPSTDEPLTVRQVANEVVRCIGAGSVVERPPAMRLKEAKLLKLDSSKAHSQLGWRALLTDSERIQWTAEWYRVWQAQPSQVWSQTREQIDRYVEKIRRNDRMAAQWFGQQIPVGQSPAVSANQFVA